MLRIKTLGWSGVENFSRQILSLVFFFAIVRYLQPSDLGVFSLAAALNAIFAVFIDEPIGEALVQKATVSAEDWNTGFTINVMVAGGFVVVAALSSGLMAWVLNEPRLIMAVPVMAVSGLVGAFGGIHRAYLSRQIRFRTIAQIALASQVIGGLAGLGMAMAGLGYWAQIGVVAVSAAAATLMFASVTPWRPRLRIHRATITSRLPYAFYSAMVRSIYLVRDYMPVIVFGLLAGVAEVGLLSLALRVGRSVGQLFEDLSSRPVLSLLSREQHDIAGFGRVLLDIMTIIGLIAIPAFAGLAQIGQRLIPIVFGAVWAPTGAMLPWVCAVLGGWLLLHIVIVSLRARNLGRLAVYVTAPAVFGDAVAVIGLAPFGLQWALIGWAARALLSVPIALVMLRRYLGVSPADLGRRWAVPLVAAGLMIALLRLMDASGTVGNGPLGLLVEVCSATAFYGAVVLAGMPNLQRRIRSVLRPS
jgi:O-antigen/teichoic acid export membrane protein